MRSSRSKISQSNIPLSKSRRTLSSDNLNVPQGVRKSSSNFLDPRFNLRRSNSVVSIRGSTTPLRSTPGYGKSTSPSPHRYSTALINSKQFSDDQLRKVHAFMIQRIPDFEEIYSLKPISMSSFILVAKTLFKEIDERTDINKDNFKDAVPKYLKFFKYPGQISMSLFKSLSAPTSWGACMAILGFLVDLVERQNNFKDDCHLNTHTTLKFSKSCVSQSNDDVDLALASATDEILGFTTSEMAEDEKKLAIFKQVFERASEDMKEEQQIKNDLLTKLNKMTEQIDHICNKTEKLALEKEKKELKETIVTLPLEEEILKELNEMRKKNIRTPKYTEDDALKVKKRLAEEQFHLESATKAFNEAHEMKSKTDLDIMEYKRKAELQVRQINNRLLQISMDPIIPDEIQFSDKGFGCPGFMEQFEKNKESLLNIKSHIAELITKLAIEKNKVEQKKESLEKQFTEIKNENFALVTEHEKWKGDLDRVASEVDVLVQQKNKEMADILKGAPNLDALAQQRCASIYLLQDLYLQLEKNIENYWKCARKLKEDFNQVGGEMNEIVSKICEKNIEFQEARKKDQLNKLEKKIQKVLKYDE